MVTGPFSLLFVDVTRTERMSLRANGFHVVAKAKLDEMEKKAINVDEQWTEAGESLASLS